MKVTKLLLTLLSLTHFTVEAYSISDLGEWKTSIKYNKQHQYNVTLLLNAKSNSYGDDHTTMLVIQCREGKTHAYIAWDELTDGLMTKVKYRFDENDYKSGYWFSSIDMTASSIPGLQSNNLDEKFSFIKQMIQTKSFEVSITPYNEIALEAKFNTAGLEVAIIPVRKACHWTEKDLEKEKTKRKVDAKLAKEQALYIKEKEKAADEHALHTSKLLQKYKHNNGEWGNKRPYFNELHDSLKKTPHIVAIYLMNNDNLDYFLSKYYKKNINIYIDDWLMLPEPIKEYLDKSMTINIIKENRHKADHLPQELYKIQQDLLSDTERFKQQ